MPFKIINWEIWTKDWVIFVKSVNPLVIRIWPLVFIDVCYGGISSMGRHKPDYCERSGVANNEEIIRK